MNVALPLQSRTVAPPPAREPDPVSLSQRQREILLLLSDGKSNKEIAHLLGLSQGTVKQHVFALFRKLKVTNRTMAVVRARQRKVDLSAPGEALESSPSLPTRSPRLERRPITVVAVEWRPDCAAALAPGALLECQMAASERTGWLAAAYGGVHTPLPGGDCFVCFGLPRAHGDEPGRARDFAAALLSGAAPGGLRRATTLRPATAQAGLRPATAQAGLRPAVAIVTAPAVVDVDCGTRVLTEAFRLAASRVRSAETGFVASAAPAMADRPGLPDLVGEAMRACRGGEARWLSVEAWPSAAAYAILDAMGPAAEAAGLVSRRLRLPADPAEIEACLLAQLGCRDADLAGAVESLCATGPAFLAVYGPDSLDAFRSCLGGEGLARLGRLPLVVAACTLRRAGPPQAAVRPLATIPLPSSSRPAERVIVAPEPDCLSAAIQERLDSLSPQARLAARMAAASPSLDAAALARSLGAGREEMACWCAEIERSGLADSASARIRFRDHDTAERVRASLVA